MKDSALLKGGIILLVTINIFNLLNFLYSMVMVRLLSLADFGVLTTLTYVIISFGVVSESIQLIISRYSTVQTSTSSLYPLLKKSLHKAARVATILFGAYLLLAIPGYFLLDIDYTLLGVTGLMIFASFFLPIARGVLQGRKKFSALGTNSVVEGLGKFIVSITLVYLGFGVYGAIIGIVSGATIAFLASFIPLRVYRTRKQSTPKTEGIYSYSRPTFVTTLAIIFFLSIDIIFARLFFDPESVGAYAIASTLAKILFMGTHPISRAMFPLSGSQEKHSRMRNLLTAALLLITIIVFWTVLTFVFPEYIVAFYAGESVAMASALLPYVSIAIGLLSITNLLLLHTLSKGKPISYTYLLTPLVVQISLLSLFHNTIIEFTFALIASAAFFLWCATRIYERHKIYKR